MSNYYEKPVIKEISLNVESDIAAPDDQMQSSSMVVVPVEPPVPPVSPDAP